MRTILHVDMDAFFAAIELLRHPELKGQPLVVGGSGDPHKRGVVSTASYEARRYGIHSAMPLRTAYHHYPEAVFLPVDFRYYTKISKRIKAILRRFSSRMEDGGLDEAFLDVSHCDDTAERVAREIKEQVEQETGLTCSVGIGPIKLLAKIASDLEKPDGLTRLNYEDIPTRVWPLPVRKLWGVGPKGEIRLAKLGVTTIGELAALPLEMLLYEFGDVHGHYLHQAANGRDDSPLEPKRQRKSISQELTFQHDVSDLDTLTEMLSTLSRDAVARLRQYHYRARTITLKLRFKNFETHTRSLTLENPTDDLSTVVQTARQCLERIELTKPIRLIGVRLSHLETHRQHHDVIGS